MNVFNITTGQTISSPAVLHVISVHRSVVASTTLPILNSSMRTWNTMIMIRCD